MWHSVSVPWLSHEDGKLRLSSQLFKLGTRIVCGLNGSVWAGTSRLTHHLRTMFEDGPHGANMQCTSILQNLHTAAMLEGHLPRILHIGADNTPKETKNSTTMAFLVWLLCVLMDTPLFEFQVHFLLVGHTHNEVVLPAYLPHGSGMPAPCKQAWRLGPHDAPLQHCARIASSPGWPQRWLARTTSPCSR